MQQTFGKYSLIDRLAFGGMAEVFLANVHGEAGFSKQVVIKRLHPRLSEDAEFTRMLIDEARITSQLTHINICQVLDLGQLDGSYFIAMEYVPGEDLRTLQDHYRRQRLYMPVQMAVYVVSELLAGLDYAHRKEDAEGKLLGVIHRDISPQNLLISYEGEVKIIDFGIAKARQRLVQTQAGVIKGKFRYMSPEQAVGGKVDHRTDIFAAGVVLYELLRGEPHSLNVPDTEVLRRMRDAEFEPVKRDEREVPGVLLRVLARALERHPRKRYSSAGEFRQALVALLPQLPPVFREQTTPLGRSELGVVMKRIFPLDRRRRRSGSSQQALGEPREARAPRRADDATGVEQGDEAPAPPPSPALSLAPAASPANKGAPLPRESTTPISQQDGSPVLPSPARRHGAASSQRLPPVVEPAGQRPANSQSMTIVGEPSAEELARDAVEAGVGRRGRRRESGRPPDDDLSTFAAATRLRPEVGPEMLLETGFDAEAVAARSGDAGGRGRSRGAGAFSRSDPSPPDRAKQPPEPLREVTFGLEQSTPAREPSGALPAAPLRGHSTRVEAPLRASPPTGGALKGSLLTLLVLGLVAGAFLAGRYVLDGELRLPWEAPSPRDAGESAPEGRGDARGPALTAAPEGFVQVRVETTPPGARLEICGKRVRRTTPLTLRVRRGRKCLLSLELEGYEAHRAQVRFDKRRPEPIRVKLARATAAGGPDLSRQGLIVVTALRVGTVYVNGVAMGQTPRVELSLNPGQYSVWVHFPALGIQTGARIVYVTVGEQQTLHFDPSM